MAYPTSVVSFTTKNTGDAIQPSHINDLQTEVTALETGLLNGLSHDLFTVAWTDYSGTSTVTGWTSFTTKVIRYKKVGKLVFVEFTLDGTSNATSASFTLPYATASSPATTSFAIGLTIDNGSAATTSGRGDMATLTCTLTPNNAGGNWTASGQKLVRGQFFYEAST